MPGEFAASSETDSHDTEVQRLKLSDLALAQEQQQVHVVTAEEAEELTSIG